MTSSPAIDADGVAVRGAEEADLPAIREIEIRSFPTPWPYDAFERFLGRSGFLVAEADGAVVGYVVADLVASHGRPVGHVKNLAVHPERRREGIAATLLARALMVLAGGGAASVKLEVRRSNHPARELYGEFGFEPVHAVPDYYEDGETAVVLVSELHSGLPGDGGSRAGGEADSGSGTGA